MNPKEMSLKQLREAIAEKSAKMHKVFDEAGADLDFTKITSLQGDTGAKVDAVKAMEAELGDLNAEYQVMVKIEKSRDLAKNLNRDFNQPAVVTHPAGEQVKSIGQLIMEHKSELVPGGKAVSLDYNIKTLFETTAGWSPESIRLPGARLAPARPIVVVDYIPQIPTSQAAIIYMLESTATFNALEKGEGLAFAESQFVLTATTETVRKVTTSLPITDEQFEDVPAAEAYINQRLIYDLQRRLDLQVLEGLGTGVLLKGTLSIGGSLQTQALGTDPLPDAIYKAFDKIRTVGFAEPSVLFINPTDWQPVRLLRTADGIYIFGSPMDAGPMRIWGVPVVQTTAVTVNTAICGDYAAHSALYIRHGVDVQVGYVGDNFKEGKKTIRADIRCAMVHFRTSAFATITGI